MWIIEGGRTQQSASGGVSSASSSISVRSFGRSNTHTLSSLSTAKPVTPPIFHLLGKGLGQSGSNLNLGAVCSGAPESTQTTSRPRPANGTNARFAVLSMSPPVHRGLILHQAKRVGDGVNRKLRLRVRPYRSAPARRSRRQAAPSS